jgi:hypothetical protein
MVANIFLDIFFLIIKYKFPKDGSEKALFSILVRLDFIIWEKEIEENV